jgi:hypothetical protein
MGQLGATRESSNTSEGFNPFTILTRTKALGFLASVTGSIVSHISQSIAMIAGKLFALRRVREEKGRVLSAHHSP